MKKIRWAVLALAVAVPGVIIHSYGVVSGKSPVVVTGISAIVSNTNLVSVNTNNTSKNIISTVPTSSPTTKATPASPSPTSPSVSKSAKPPTPVPSITSPSAPAPSSTQTSPDATPPPPTPGSGPDIAPESSCPGENNVAQAQIVLVCMTSYARAQHGLGAVAANSALMDAAVAKAQDIINCGFSHTACGHEFYYWMVNKGYTGNCLGENIAQGQSSPLEVFTAWMNSPGHKANILNASFKDIGIAGTNSSQGIVWVQEFGGC